MVILNPSSRTGLVILLSARTEPPHKSRGAEEKNGKQIVTIARSDKPLLYLEQDTALVKKKTWSFT